MFAQRDVPGEIFKRLGIRVPYGRCWALQTSYPDLIQTKRFGVRVFWTDTAIAKACEILSAGKPATGGGK